MTSLARNYFTLSAHQKPTVGDTKLSLAGVDHLDQSPGPMSRLQALHGGRQNVRTVFVNSKSVASCTQTIGVS
jgi:hypothetical protein